MNRFPTDATMNEEPFTPPDATAESNLSGLLQKAEDYARREPAKAAAAAFGAGLLLNVIPPRLIIGTVAAVTVPFVRPALFALGLLKAFELCSKDDAAH